MDSSAEGDKTNPLFFTQTRDVSLQGLLEPEAVLEIVTQGRVLHPGATVGAGNKEGSNSMAMQGAETKEWSRSITLANAMECKHRNATRGGELWVFML